MALATEAVWPSRNADPMGTLTSLFAAERCAGRRASSVWRMSAAEAAASRLPRISTTVCTVVNANSTTSAT
jgi:ferritin-like protein